MLKIVVALGGNALQTGNNVSAKDQLNTCKRTASGIVELIKQGHQVAIVHGNGPQVGEIVANMEAANKIDNIKYQLFPFDVCNAFTQGYIGYHLQNAIGEELNNNNIKKNIATIVTQIEVSSADSAFLNPSKPIGSFYNKDDATRLMQSEGYIMREDAGRGWRRVIASPKPIDIIEKDVIKDLFDRGLIVISCGGGGIPVERKGIELIGVEAVIDKDFAAAKLAQVIEADMLLILTAVDSIYINFNQPNQERIARIGTIKAKKYIEDGQFAPGSMLPKIQAAINFLENNTSGKVLITSLEKVSQGLQGITGTVINYGN